MPGGGWCSEEGAKTKSEKKKLGKRGGGSNPSTLIDKEAKSDKKNLIDKEAKSDKKKQTKKTVGLTVSNEVNTKMQLSTKCRACGTINISKYVNIFLSINTTTFTTFILSSLVSEFCQRI